MDKQYVIYIYSEPSYSHKKEWMKLKNIMLSEISCKKKKKNRGEQILYDSTHTTYQKQANSEEKLD